MGKAPGNISKALQQRRAEQLLRSLTLKNSGIDFISNDYLGFSNLNLLSAYVHKTYPDHIDRLGSGGSRLISGNSEFTEQTETKIARFHHAESALIFNSGYDANLGLLSSVPQKNDLVITDELIHASIHDGIRLSYARQYKFSHNDVKHLEELLKRHTASFENIYVVVESVYSMDGDEAPLKEIVALLDQYRNVFLIVDEAHAIGVFGDKGRGLCSEHGIEEKCLARIYTYGKAMGCHGAAVLGNNELRNYLINFARSFIYTTALPGHSIAAISAAYDLLSETDQIQALHHNIGYFLQGTKDLHAFIKSRSAIQCILINGNQKVVEVEKQLAARSVNCKAVKSPTVKEGSERIRICLHAFNTKSEIDGLINGLKEAL